jgi:hypothetical protein
MEITIVLLLLLMGVIFFLLELFLIPVFQSRYCGNSFYGGAVYYAYTAIGTTAGHLTLAGGVLLWQLLSGFHSFESS